MQCGQESHVGTEKAASFARYVHFKDFKKKDDPSVPWGWKNETCTVGKGDVDLEKCIEALKSAGYDGFVALEYEGPDDGQAGVSESIDCMNRIF